LNLPTDYPRPAFQSFDGGSVEFAIRDNQAAALRQMVRDYDTTLYVILLAVYYILLAKYTGQEQIIIGTSTAGRTHPQLHRLVGMFINMAPMRNYPTENKSFSDFLKEVRENVLKAFENQDYPYEELLRKLDLHGDPSRDPLNIAVFVIHNHRYNGKRRMGNITISPYNYDPQKTNFDLNLSAVEQGDIIAVTLQYAVALFKHSTASLMAKHYMEILEQVLENEHVQLRDIKITFKSSSLKSKALEEGEGDFLF
jgi:non-ribosomal peptide synthetase component F